MERCPNCGNRLSKIDVLCPKCAAVVEVIQIKSSILLNPEAQKQTKPDAENTVKRDFSEAFVVYNEDFPTEEPANGVSAAADAVKNEAARDQSTETGPEQSEAQIDEPLSYEPPVSSQPELHDIAVEKSVEDRISDTEYDNDYSARYLEHLKNINLPELDDIQSFDPEEFMREYRRSKEASAENSLSEEVLADKHRLETGESFETENPAAADEIAQNTEDTETASPERRYRAAESIANPGGQKTPVKREKEKKLSTAVSILLWLVVSAAFFVGFMFFDGYVQKAYGNYNSFIYTISDGKIDLEPGD